jgi:aminocarboxymuconate-semialdehyde decarboxylase
MIRELGAPDYRFATDAAGATTIEFRGTRFFGVQPPMTDAALRVEEMDRVGVDVQVLSLSVPNVYFAAEEREPEIARRTNDAYAELIARYPRRFKALASIPMDVPDEASKELARSLDELKLQGVLLLSHIRGKPLTDPRFRPFFQEADRRSLFVLIHPMLPVGMAEQLKDYVLGPLVGFPFDSTLAVARMCFDGLFRDFPNVRFLVPHLGGAIPYLLPRLDQGYRDFPANRAKIDQPPSFYLKKLYYTPSPPELPPLLSSAISWERSASLSDPTIPTCRGRCRARCRRSRARGCLKPRRRGCSPGPRSRSCTTFDAYSCLSTTMGSTRVARRAGA